MNLKGILVTAVLCTASTLVKAQVEEPVKRTDSPEEIHMVEPPPADTAMPVEIYEVAAVDMSPYRDRVAVKIVISMQGKVISAKAIPGRSSTANADILHQAEQRARTLVYEASKTTKPDERVVFVRLGEPYRAPYPGN